ncbi:U4/U6.U5 snRNP associated protein [Coemansia erecta]|nr:U4/U6.U5 snRNP associated protein [Coemansia sp. RSA 2618]KAJ2817488.1 U4/U6.U5 snRNP associated protein [Coemansia erecta]
MGEKNAYGGEKASDGFRRQWDTAAYEQKARDREQQLKQEEENDERRHKGLKPLTKKPAPSAPRELLEARKASVRLDKMVGKSQIVQASSAAAGQPGFYCKECDITVKDSLSFLDHINGKKHQRELNRVMKVRNETVDDVIAKLDALRAARRRKLDRPEYDFYEQVRVQQQMDAEKRLKRREARRKQRRAKTAADAGAGDQPDEMAAMLGFSSFGSSKK